MQLKEALDLYGRATNPNPAWGYSPNPLAKRTPNGPIEVTTYHFEGDWQTHTCQTPEEVDVYLYTEGDRISGSIEGKQLEARLRLTETGFQLQCSINGTPVSVADYKGAVPAEWREEGPILPGYWDGPGEWEAEQA